MQQTVTAAVGSVLALDYERPEMDWTDTVDGTIVQAIAPGRVRAASRGQATVTSTGRLRCTVGAACTRLVAQFQFTLVVS